MSSAVSRTTIFSGVTISSWNVSGIGIRLQASGFRLRDSAPLKPKAAFSGCCFQFFGCFLHFVDCAFHVEGLLGNLVMFAFYDFLETLHCVGDFHVATRRSGELLGYVERLRQETLDL